MAGTSADFEGPMDGADSIARSPIFTALVDFAAAFPLLSVIGVLAVLWAVAQLTVKQRSGSPVGGEASKDEALARARQIQQERMERAAAARAAAAEGAVSSARTVAAAVAGPSKSAQPSQPDRQPAAQPAKPAAVARSADDPKSVSARLAKIEKGKGPSQHNPLQSYGESSSSASSVICRRKGG
jgi:hypothetical protein